MTLPLVGPLLDNNKFLFLFLLLLDYWRPRAIASQESDINNMDKSTKVRIYN
jgi:hypothetical protein